MAIPTSPSVVVLENDVSIYTPNINSSVVGLVGFANKGPTDKATLITSQENLLRVFGKPDSNLEGQGLEGALEILEATNQIYFVRSVSSSAAAASAAVAVGACPAVKVEGYTPTTAASSIYYSLTDNAATTTVTGTVELVSSTSFGTSTAIFQNAFNPGILNDQPIFSYVDGSDIYLASRYAGSGASLQVSAADSGIVFSGLDVSGNASATGGSSVTTKGFTSSSVTLDAYSVYPGTGYNLSSLRDGSIQGVSVEINNLSVRDQVVVNSEGAQAESFNDTELSPSSPNSVEFLLIDDVNNNKSEYIYTELMSGTASYAAPDQFGATATAAGFAGGALGTENSHTGTPRFVKVIEGTYSLAGGDSGAGNVQSMVGNAASKTGMHALDDDSLNISLAVIPGVTEDIIQNALITLAESSKNFLALVSPPLALGEVQDATDWINGKDQSTRAAALNSSYAACNWPWVQVFNPFAAAEEWYDPAIFAARQCVFTDAVSDPWFAPAGFRRGRLTKPTATEVVLNQGDRDALYSNSINPVANDPTTGITIFGQRTTQRTPTALDRINTRRLMIYIRKVLLQLGKPFQFEPNDQFTWELVEDAINPFLDDLLARRAIVEGAVKCDSTTNTPLRVDRNELWCSVTIKPTKAAETIVFEVNLTSQSATLNG
jgi:phage tail sheath protein FI